MNGYRPKMLLLHKGFDSLDLAFPLTVSDGIAALLEEVKLWANESRQERSALVHNDRWLYVYAKGLGGGFAYRGTFDSPGHNWFLKKPTLTRDKWGIRVSCAARDLAIDGITGVRSQLDDTLGWLGLQQTVGTESLARIDFAMDFLAPDFVLNADHFVMHPRNIRACHRLLEPLDIKENGRSGRTTSVTIGKNPNRQVIIYDKREEVMRKPSHVPFLWDETLAFAGLPALDLSKPKLSRVWRVEIRFYKKYLKETWGVTTFGDLAAAILPMLRKTVDDIRYTQPNGDSNRSRWPDHPIWQRVREEIECDYATVRTEADKETIATANLATKDGYLARQIAGCMLNRAALRNASTDELTDFILNQARQIAENLETKRDKTADKLAKAKDKYGRR